MIVLLPTGCGDQRGVASVAGLPRLHRRHRARRSEEGVADVTQVYAQSSRQVQHERGKLHVQLYACFIVALTMFGDERNHNWNLAIQVACCDVTCWLERNVVCKLKSAVCDAGAKATVRRGKKKTRKAALAFFSCFIISENV